MKKQPLLVALIVKPQGIRGEVKVKTYTDDANSLAAFSSVLIDGKPYPVLRVRGAVGDCAFVTLAGVPDRNAAELLRGKEMFVDRDDAPLEDDRFYIVDIIGCKLVDEDNTVIGTITDILPAATDVYVVEIGGKEVMFAAPQGVILSIEPQNERVVVCRKRFEEVAAF